MLIQIWTLLFAIAAVTTGATVTERLPTVIGAAAGILLWVVVAYGALNIVVIDGGEVAHRAINQPLAFLGLAGVVLNLITIYADATGQLSSDARAVRGRES